MTQTHESSTLPVDVRQRLEEKAKAMMSQIGSAGGDKIRVLRSKQFKLPQVEQTNDMLRVVVLDFVSYNAFFDRPWKEGDATPPACFALGSNPRELAPHASSPQKQSDTTCADCPNNEFGSAGSGKACGNHRILAVVEPTDKPDAPIYLLQLSPTAVKHWDAYVNGVLLRFKLPTIGVVTDITFDPAKEYPSLRFGNPTPNPNIGLHMGRQEQALARLLQAPDVSGWEPLKQKAGRK